MRSVFGDSRQAFIGRELSKLHEQCVPGSLAELADSLADGRIPLKGEFVIGVGGTTDTEKDACAADADRWLGELMAVMPGKQAVDIVARATGVPRNTVYQQMLARKKADS